jgi:hypothetical protein
MNQETMNNELQALSMGLAESYDKWRAEYKQHLRKLLVATIMLYVKDLEENPQLFQRGAYYCTGMYEGPGERQDRISAWTSEMGIFSQTYGEHNLNQDMIDFMLQDSVFCVEDRGCLNGFRVTYKG